MPWASFATPGPSGEACTIRNAAPLTFPAPSGDWGTVRFVRLIERATGRTIGSADLTIPREIRSGSPARSFAPGALRIERD